MADVVIHNPGLLPLINRFGIELGFAEKSVNDLCVANDINVDFFLEIANAYLDVNYFPKVQLQTFPVSHIISYLRKTHQYYLESAIPEIENLISELQEASFKQQANIDLLRKYFSRYKNEVSKHIQREEDRVFPYVLQIEQAYANLNPSKKLVDDIRAYSVSDYFEEHEDVESELFDLKSIIIKYIPQPKEVHIVHKLLNLLFLFEKDLSDHSRIEDKVLVPKVAVMERELMSIHQAQNK